MNDDMGPDLDELWQEADEHVNRGDFDKAVEIYRYILIRYVDNSLANESANAHLGDVLLTLGQTDLAESHIRNALSYNPENPKYHSLLGFVYYTRYEWENAVKQYKLAFDKEPWNRDYLHAVAVAAFNSGDRKTGLEYLHRVLPLYPDNSGMLAELATAYMSLGDIESARLYAEKAVRTNPADVMAHAVLMRIKQEIRGLP